MTTESVGSYAGSPLELAGPMSPLREEKEISPNTPDRRRCREKDICYHCKQEGHWAADCPNKNKDTPVSSPNKAFPKCPQKYPELPCRVCGQPCVVRTSWTDKNPGRDFYKCARDSKCDMFQWCDELGKIRPSGANSPLKPAMQRGATASQNPECTCTAGPCRVETKRNGRKYFACHLKSGQGACVHFEWCDGLGDDVDLNNNLMTEELKNAASNNHREIKEMEVEEEIVVPTGPPPPPLPPPPPPPAELKAGSASAGSSPVKRPNFTEGGPSKRKCIEELTSQRAASPSLNCYLDEEPNNLETSKGAVGNRDDTDSGETLVLDSQPAPPPECLPLKRLSLNEGNSANPQICVLCEEVGHVVTECPDFAIMW